MVKSARSTTASRKSSNTTPSQPAPIPAPVRDRPSRKAKQVALEQKVWTNDLPATRKRALSAATDVAQSVKPKKAKGQSAKSSGEGTPTIGTLDQESEVNVEPPRFSRKRNVLLASDLDSSDEEDDILLRTAGARSAPHAPARAAPSTEKSTHVKDLQDPEDKAPNSEEDLSDDDVDPEAREQALAEQSESDDEVLASMETRGDTENLGIRLAAEPTWSEKATPKGAPSEDKRKHKSNHASEKKAAGLSKSELRAQQERPVFKTPAKPTVIPHPTVSTASKPSLPAPPVLLPAALETGEDDDSSDSDSDIQMVDAIAPHDYHIVYPTQGGPLSLKAQHPDIQEAIQATITRLERKIVLEDAFPDAHKRGRGVRQTMVETVREVAPKEKFHSLLTRLITDAQFLKSLSSIPNQRISTFRGKIKEKSNVAVTSFFGLVPGQAQERVEWLLPHLIYIYPTDFEKRQISDDRPYRAPVVLNVLRESFFKGAKSFSSRNEDIFTSSLLYRDEREIPLVMLALVGAAIHASLIDWRSGNCVEASHFSADRYLDAYAEHKVLLEQIKKSAPVKYHTMMYKLYDEASGAAPAIHVAPLGTSAIDHLNLAAMEED